MKAHPETTVGHIHLTVADLDGASDHGVSEAIYLRDPDNNGVEIYVDRPKSSWKVSNDGMVEMDTLPLDIESLLKEVE